MKNCLIVLFVFVALNVCAQKTFELKDLFTAKTVVWYGIDYSKTSFVGPFMGKDLNIYFHAWNSLIIEEPRKYNVARSMYKASVINDISTIEKLMLQRFQF